MLSSMKQYKSTVRKDPADPTTMATFVKKEVSWTPMALGKPRIDIRLRPGYHINSSKEFHGKIQFDRLNLFKGVCYLGVDNQELPRFEIVFPLMSPQSLLGTCMLKSYEFSIIELESGKVAGLITKRGQSLSEDCCSNGVLY